MLALWLLQPMQCGTIMDRASHANNDIAGDLPFLMANIIDCDVCIWHTCIFQINFN